MELEDPTVFGWWDFFYSVILHVMLLVKIRMATLPQQKKKKIYKRWWFWFLIIIFVFISIVFIAGKSSYAKKQLADYAYLNETVGVTSRDIRKTISTTGTIVPDESTIFSATTQGTVTDVHFSVGDDVNTGDIIIETDEEEITAPFDGRILHISTFVGDRVDMTKSLVEVGYRSNHIEFLASDSEVIDLKKDQSVLMNIPSYNSGRDEYTGHVQFVDVKKQDQVASSQSGASAETGYLVQVSLDDPEMPEELKRIIGLGVDMEIEIDEKTDTLSIPTGAVQYDDNNQAFVYRVPTVDDAFVQKAKTVEDVVSLLKKQKIEVGFVGDEYTEVTDGLQEGENVLLYIPAVSK